MGPVAYFSLCLLGCLIFNPSLAASNHGVLSTPLPPGTLSLNGAKSCPNGWLPSHSSCYGYFPEEKNWMEAEVHCQHQRNGAHLASIHSAEENNKLAKYIKEKHKKESAVWIGLSDSQKNRGWRWVDKSPFSFEAWDEGQPNYLRGIEFCAGLHPGKGFQKWHDYPCEHRHAFICKCEH
ncbi:C-type lectin BpLec-like [Mauremys reevesii]|uniref:C-type lectin BpLec-like n=1 Tax=Mauremys reevesii TaxID=260615 RepID=UPI00193EFF29|nr:C-type lectin BpLec-like [Mauremys reevesii]XP_039376228.1 C-type lectin BpLec-like [Mauremys reevesii]